MLNKEKVIHHLINHMVTIESIVAIIRKEKKIDEEMSEDFEEALRQLKKNWEFLKNEKNLS